MERMIVKMSVWLTRYCGTHDAVYLIGRRCPKCRMVAKDNG